MAAKKGTGAGPDPARAGGVDVAVAMNEHERRVRALEEAKDMFLRASERCMTASTLSGGKRTQLLADALFFGALGLARVAASDADESAFDLLVGELRRTR